MILTEARIVSIEVSPDNHKTWTHIQSRASAFINSVSYNHLAKGKRPDEDVSLDIDGKPREFRPLIQGSGEGKISLYLGHQDLADKLLLLVLKPNEDPKKFDFKLLSVAVVNNPNESRSRT